MPKFKGKVWGFQKKDVEGHIDELIKIHEAGLVDLTEQIKKLQKDNEVLEQELTALAESDTLFPKEELLELALKRIDKIAKFVDQDVYMEVLAIEKVSHQKLRGFDNDIAEIDLEIEKEKQIIEKELRNIVEIVKGQDRKKNLNMEVMKSIGKLLPIADWLKSNREDQSENNKDKDWEEKLNDGTQELINQMTADGTTPELIMPILVKPDARKNNVQTEIGESLENLRKETGDPALVETYSPISKAVLWDAAFETDAKLSHQAIAVTQEEAVSENQDYYKPMEQGEGRFAETLSGQPQMSVRQEIPTARVKFILGKVAGENITDSDGRIIIQKGDPITVEVMQSAQNEGKLADLIINMV